MEPCDLIIVPYTRRAVHSRGCLCTVLYIHHTVGIPCCMCTALSALCCTCTVFNVRWALCDARSTALCTHPVVHVPCCARTVLPTTRLLQAQQPLLAAQPAHRESATLCERLWKTGWQKDSVKNTSNTSGECRPAVEGSVSLLRAGQCFKMITWRWK